MQVAAEKYGPHSEGMDLSLARQRYYVSTHTGLIRQMLSELKAVH